MVLLHHTQATAAEIFGTAAAVVVEVSVVTLIREMAIDR